MAPASSLALFTQDVQASKASFINKTQQCFAVRGAVDGFLDLARSIFCRLTEQIHDMAEALKTELELPSLKVRAFLPLSSYLSWPECAAAIRQAYAHT